MSRMPCSITDDPYNDYSDYIEGTGVYSTKEENDDCEYDNHRDAFKSAGEPLITPYNGDKT